MEENEKITMLLVGDSTWPMYVNAFYKAGQEIANVKLFDLGKLNSGKINNNIILKIENKLSIGVEVSRRNHKLLKYAKQNDIEYIFLYSARIISWRTVKKLKKMGLTIAGYCNDNPFSSYYAPYFWRNIRKSVEYCDITYSYRNSDIGKYKAIGAKDVRLLRAYYNEDRSYKMNTEDFTDLRVPKVVFLGHLEDDERVEYLDALIDKGIEIGIRETVEWKKYAGNREKIIIFPETVDHYNEILNRAEIALVFLSKINQDTYTRRCFEITATGTMMLAPYNEDLATLFKEDKEVVFYRSKDDFVSKIEYYLKYPEKCKQIGMRGRERVLKDGHGSRDRIKQVLADMFEIRKAKR